MAYVDWEREQRKKEKIIEFTLYLIFGIIFAALIIIPVSIPYWNEKEYICDEIMVFQDNDKTLYKVKIGEEERIFENEDLLFIGKTNSSFYGAELKEVADYNEELVLNGWKIKITTRGFRIPFLSSYQNICDFEVLT